MADHMLPCSQATLDHLHKMVPGLGDAGAEEKMARVAQHLHTYSMMDDGDAGGAAAIGTMSREDIIKTAATNRKAIKDERDRLAAERVTLNSTVQEMSRKVIQPLGEEAESAVVESLETKSLMCFSRGSFDRTTKGLLDNLLIGEPGKRNTLTMSRAANPAGDKSLASALYDVLLNNQPITVDLGAKTEAQNMSRQSPGGEPTAEEKKVADAKAALDQASARMNPVAK